MEKKKGYKLKLSRKDPTGTSIPGSCLVTLSAPLLLVLLDSQGAHKASLFFHYDGDPAVKINISALSFTRAVTFADTRLCSETHRR